MLFLIHDDDGRISQSNKIMDWKKGSGNGRSHNHDDLLHEHGQKFVMADEIKPLHPDDYFIKGKEITERKPLPFVVDRTEIAVGDNDAVKFFPIPPKTRIRVSCGGMVFVDEIVTGRLVEYSAPVPGIYVFEFDRFPYRPSRFEVIAR